MKKYNTKSVIPTFSYEPNELSELLGVHQNTVYRWQKNGLKPIDESGLILGSELKRFLNEQKKKRKIRLAPNEFFCLKCKTATTSKISALEYTENGKTYSNNTTQIVINGICIKCESKIKRYESSSSIEKFKSFYRQDV